MIYIRTKSVMRRVLSDPRATHYEVLGISPGELDPAELKDARRCIALLFHPDLVADQDRRTAHDLMSRANTAYRVLSNNAERVRYDASLLSTHGKCPVCSGEGFKRKQRGFKSQDKLKCLGCDGNGWVLKPAVKSGQKRSAP